MTDIHDRKLLLCHHCPNWHIRSCFKSQFLHRSPDFADSCYVKKQPHLSKWSTRWFAFWFYSGLRLHVSRTVESVTRSHGEWRRLVARITTTSYTSMTSRPNSDRSKGHCSKRSILWKVTPDYILVIIYWSTCWSLVKGQILLLCDLSDLCPEAQLNATKTELEAKLRRIQGNFKIWHGFLHLRTFKVNVKDSVVDLHVLFFFTFLHVTVQVLLASRSRPLW